MLALGLSARAPAAPGPSWVVVAADLGCPAPHSPLAVARDIERLLAGDMPVAGPLPRLELLRAGSEHVIVRFQAEGTAGFQRTLQVARADCDSLAETVALMVRGALVRPWGEYLQALAPPLPTDPLRTPLQASATASPPDQAPDAPALPRWRASLLAGGYAGLGDGWPLGPSGALQLDLDFAPHLGIALQIGANGALKKALSTQRVAASTVALASALTVVLARRSSVYLRALAGPALQRLEVTRHSGALEQSVCLFRPGALAALQGRAGVAPGLSVTGGFELSFHRAETIVVPRDGRVLTVPRARLAVRLGLSWGPD